MKRVHGGSTGVDLDFSANINPLGLPALVVQAITDAVPELLHYPDAACARLRRALAARNDCPESWVVCGNGAVELIFASVYALRPRRVLICVPSFCEYQLAARAGGAEVVLIPPEPGCLDLNLSELARRLRPADLGIVCNPNNPTGLMCRTTELSSLLTAARAQLAHLLVDEAFMDFVPQWRDLTAAHFLRAELSPQPQAELIVLRSLTKFYAMPGLRLGYALASPSMIRRMEGAKDPWSVNTLAQAAGVVALSDAEYERDTLALIALERGWLYAKLNALPDVEPIAGAAANFILLRLHGDRGSGLGPRAARMPRAAEVAAALRAHHSIAVRDCSSFDSLEGQYIRIAVRNRAANAQLVKALSEVVGS